MKRRSFFWLLSHQRGIQHAEEALLLSLIVLVAVIAVNTIGGTLNNFFTKVADVVAAAVG